MCDMPDTIQADIWGSNTWRRYGYGCLLTEGFFGRTPIVPPTMEKPWRKAEVEDITTSQSTMISAMCLEFQHHLDLFLEL